jgi:hypothetical protein
MLTHFQVITVHCGCPGKILYVGQFAATATGGYVAGSAPYYRPRKFLTSETLEDAIRGSDQYLETKVFRGVRPAGYVIL